MVYISPNLKDLGAGEFGRVDEAMRRGYRAFKISRPKISSILSRKR
jgi:hypothetical protein